MPTAVEEKLIDIKYKLDMYYSLADSPESTLEKIEDVIKPKVKLNENQMVVLEWLKSIGTVMPIYRMADLLKWAIDSTTDGKDLSHALAALSGKEEFQVLAAFAEWGMKNEKSD